MAISLISTSYMAAPSLMAPHQPLLRAHPSSLQLPRRGLAIAATAAKASSTRRGKLPPVEEKIQKFQSFANLLENFDKPILVEFYTTWCVPCQLLGSNLIKAARLTTKHVQFVRIDVDKNRGLAAKFGIKAVPTYVIFKDGKQVDRFEGAKTIEHYVNRLQRALKEKEGAKTVEHHGNPLQRALQGKEGEAASEDLVNRLPRALKEKEGAKIAEYHVNRLKRALKEKEGPKTAKHHFNRLLRGLKVKEGKTVADYAIRLKRAFEEKEDDKTVKHYMNCLQRAFEQKKGAKTVDVQPVQRDFESEGKNVQRDFESEGKNIGFAEATTV